MVLVVTSGLRSLGARATCLGEIECTLKKEASEAKVGFVGLSTPLFWRSVGLFECYYTRLTLSSDDTLSC